jgi:hypothetical protein
VARRHPSFLNLDKAFWAFVDQHCPYPVQSRQRYAWVRENLSFEYEGVRYDRHSVTVRSDGASLGPATFAVTYTGSDGTVIRDKQAPVSLVG